MVKNISEMFQTIGNLNWSIVFIIKNICLEFPALKDHEDNVNQMS